MWREGEGKRGAPGISPVRAEIGRFPKHPDPSTVLDRNKPAKAVSVWAQPPDRLSGVGNQLWALEGEFRHVDHRQSLTAMLEEHSPLEGT
jgi:hypothetical protein